MEDHGVRDPGAHPDRYPQWHAHFRRRRSLDVLDRVTEGLVAEHASNPLGEGGRSLELQYVLNYLNAQPIAAVYCTYVAGPSTFAVLRVPRAGAPQVIGDFHDDKASVRHAIFLMQLEDLRRDVAGNE